jgi:hypothetical protein
VRFVELLAGGDDSVAKNQLMAFTAAEGAGAHCQMGALTLLHQRVFDWLDDVVVKVPQ